VIDVEAEPPGKDEVCARVSRHGGEGHLEVRTMELGPVDVVVVAFPGDVPDAMLVALDTVEASGDIRLIDALVVAKDADGRVTRAELADLESTQDLAADLLARGALGLIGIDDVDEVGQVLEPGTSALALLIEHVWARDVAEAVRDGQGSVLASVRIPHEFIAEAEQALVEAAEEPATPAESAHS
jgi:uncharacterized membrane protein